MLKQPETEILPSRLCGESRSRFRDLIPFIQPLALAQQSLTVAASEKHQEKTHLRDEGEQPAVLNQHQTRPRFPKRERVSMRNEVFFPFLLNGTQLLLAPSLLQLCDVPTRGQTKERTVPSKAVWAVAQ